MPELNWGAFDGLPGATTHNFELLWRAVIRRRFARYGDFRAHANQPGIEFHLRLQSECELGAPPRWYGWQCRWWDLPSGTPIGTTRRSKIVEAIRKTGEILPDLTDWVLCTRHTLTAGDQEWFYGLETHLSLHLWPGTDLEGLLAGPAEGLRGTYFGELILTPDDLAGIRSRAVEELRGRWVPEVHQVLDAERTLRRYLGSPPAWSELRQTSDRLEAGIAALPAEDALPSSLRDDVRSMREYAIGVRTVLRQSQKALETGSLALIGQDPAGPAPPQNELGRTVRRLRSTRSEASLDAANLLSDIRTAHGQLSALLESLDQRLVALVADAGFGKTQLAAELTESTETRPPGVLLHGRNLSAGQCLDDLARRLTIHGRRVESFEGLVAALDAAGQRSGRRLPIVIDGLNESEDPRDWKGALASLSVTLSEYDHVLVVCTLRSAFVQDALPADMVRLDIPGFEGDILEAVRRYFKHYRIDPSDAHIPFRFLNHPLTLRMFCEATNAQRQKWVGVEAMPESLTALFHRHLGHVCERIQELSSRLQRYYVSDVRSALSRVALELWERKSRSLDFLAVRQLLGDDPRPWDQSIVRALEHHDLLIRVEGNESGPGALSVVHDALAGHLIADALLERHGATNFESWLNDPATDSALWGDFEARHPLAQDIFRSLVGLSPHRRYRRQLWPLLRGSARTAAVKGAASLEASLLDTETVAAIAKLAAEPVGGRKHLFDRLWTTRAARSHPLDAHFLDSVLRPLSVPDRDLRWTEWVRARQEQVVEDLEGLERRWEEGSRPGDELRARWAMWTLTSTVRVLRDHATRVLYLFGRSDPKALFDLVVDSLEINDPYIPERMLAAAYGVAMALRADEEGAVLRTALPEFAHTLVDKMFVPNAPHPTRHILTRDSALGLIEIAMRIEPDYVPPELHPFLKAPFDHLPHPFYENVDEIPEFVHEETKSAIRMDFANYTIGRMIPDRGNYDFDHPTYREVRAQIESRIVALGYRRDRFESVDEAIGKDSWRRARLEKPQVDRYGKKYSWIAYFEMYGLRSDRGVLPEWRLGERTADVDIDPSFPKPPKEWYPSLPDLFNGAPQEPRSWLADGPTPDYSSLLHSGTVANHAGPWILLDGYFEQSNTNDDRRVFTFIRAVLVPQNRVDEFLAEIDTREHPGNREVPDLRDEHYVYAGEIPWSTRFGRELREDGERAGPDVREAFTKHDGTQWLPGIPVEIPTIRFTWEGHHSRLNQVSSSTIPAPALCDSWGLSNRSGEWDLYDEEGRPASLYREFKAESDTFGSHLSYVRADLMERYLAESGQTLVWIGWGERDFHHRTSLALQDNLRDLYVQRRHVYAHRVVHTASS